MELSPNNTFKEMASKAREKRKYIIGKNQECNKFLLLNIRYKNVFKWPLNRVNIETQANRSVIAYRPVKSRTVIESPVTDGRVFLLSLMLCEWARSTNYIEKLPNPQKSILLDIKVDGPLITTENSKRHCRYRRLVYPIPPKLITCCKYTCKQPRLESFRRKYKA